MRLRSALLLWMRRGVFLCLALLLAIVALFVAVGSITGSLPLQARQQYGAWLAHRGRSAEALEQYVYCFDHGRGVTGYGPVRRSFLLMYTLELGKVHPPAKAAIETRLAECEERLSTYPDLSARDDYLDVVAFRRALEGY
jgi:hypothetical protein